MPEGAQRLTQDEEKFIISFSNSNIKEELTRFSIQHVKVHRIESENSFEEGNKRKETFFEQETVEQMFLQAVTLSDEIERELKNLRTFVFRCFNINLR